MSESEERVGEAQRWLRFAGEDLIAATALMANAPTFARHVCWLSQQAAEKAIKAGLMLEAIRFPLTHDLDALVNLLPAPWGMRERHPDLAELTEWAASARYPGDDVELTEADAARAMSQARSLYESVVSEFGRRGIGAQ